MKTRALCCMLFALALAPAAQDLKVLPARMEGVPTTSTMMHEYLMHRARAAMAQSDGIYNALKTPEQIQAWQEKTRAAFVERLGGFPERTPLKPRVIGTIDKGEYTVEKVTFESQPDHTVTALFYRPKGQPPFPGVLVACGHSDAAKAYSEYQRAPILLARNGMAALCFDPFDQGERMQILDGSGKPVLSSTRGHSNANVGACLVGRNAATYEIWDGMRALDYLLSRAEIDPKRIGCTGISGGGTQTSYLMALDLRITAAAPGCYLTSFPRLLETLGPQDGEQNLYGQLRDGLGHAEYMMLRAPLPTLVLCATQDFFDIGGTWDSLRRASRIYARLGRFDALAANEADKKHGFTPPLRAAAARFFRRWFFNSGEVVTEPAEQPFLEEKDAWCTPRGQVVLRPGERTVYDLNAAEAERLVPARRKLWSGDRAVALAEVHRVTGIRPLGDLPELQFQKTGTVARDGYTIDKLILTPEPGIWLPALVFRPENPKRKVTLYLNGAGMAADAAPGGPLEKLVREGGIVLAVDLRGVGETADSSKDGLAKSVAPEWKDISLAYMLGTSYLAMRTEDVLACARTDNAARICPPAMEGGKFKLDLVAVGLACPPALHAAALQPELFASVTLRDRATESWDKVVHTPLAPGQAINAVFGALKVYDLPDLEQSLPAGMLK